MLRVGLLLILSASSCFSVPEVAAQAARPLRQARSENGRFVLRIQAARGGKKDTGGCQATLYERARGQRDTKRWSGRLVNEAAPIIGHIRDDGKFVITLDEFRHGGARHAVVIYDAKGKLLKEFRLNELLGTGDWKHVRARRQIVEWLPGARFKFSEQPEQFVIALKWGRRIRIDLKKLELVGDAEAEQVGEEAEIPPEILALLEAVEGEQQLVAELEQLLALGEEVTAEQQARIRAIVEELGYAPETEAAPGPTSAPGGAAETTAGEGDLADFAAADALESLAGVAGNSAEAGVPVPMPDPADPVDYVAWVNEMAATDGPSAAPLLRAAMDKVVPFEGDEDLYRAAEDGDPVALGSPEIAAWLEANRDAIQEYRDASHYEHRGFPMRSERGDMIGILLPHLSKMRSLAKATVMEARRAEMQGYPEDAADRYLDTFAAGAQASYGPTIIESLVGNAIQAHSADALLDSFEGPAASDIDYVQLAERIEGSYPSLRPAEESFQGERAFMMDVLQRMYTFDPKTKTYSVGRKGMDYYSSLFEDVEGEMPNPEFVDELNTIGYERALEQANRHYDAMTEAFQSPYREGAQVMRALDESVSSGEASGNPLMRTMMPALGRYYTLHTRAETTRRASILATNIMAYRQQYGEYPDSLDVFGDRGFVVDPFTEQRFTYRPDGDDFVLYSLGENGVDDGGAHDRSARTSDLRYWPRPDDE